jgi:hypothetical protein
MLSGAKMHRLKLVSLSRYPLLPRAKKLGRKAALVTRNYLRQKAIFASGFKLICPVQSCRKKFFAFLVGQITFTTSPVPRSSGGALRVVTNVERGMRWT